MGKVTITLEDSEGSIDISLDFDPPVDNEDEEAICTRAQFVAMEMMKVIETLKG